jgi:hypothetical protein
MKFYAAMAVAIAVLGTPMPSRTRISSIDPFPLGENLRSDQNWQNNGGYRSTGGKTLRSVTIDTGIRNLVLIVAGQSNYQNVAPTAYTPTNASALDNFNVYDGGVYAAADPLLGASWMYTTLGQGGANPSPGNIGTRVGDLLITNGQFDRVILVPVAIGGSTIEMWATGSLSNRVPTAMARLASRGIVPGMTNVEFAVIWGQGESDNTLDTSQANYTSRLNTVISNAAAAGFSGRWFINKQTWNAGSTDANVQAAQDAMPNGSTIFAGANADSLNATNRYADNTHFNDTGMAALATLVYNAMVASGAPY